eukprot:CAMPEP_0202861138 /NCGR_PEP_ID=MMETSP1391-20130828/2637_1 /ASSEMBLY_ACC=CAM_ASM_000867 /TAXON_ID=1034604 /ORGANISM="Chlamydomonas leiostraca, Strain SAG 11-49" /LENGTH=77 /DNA_ID=CAMNT_0049540469 /DNA_START=217 /DNA_END=450 /DNA_ORIENTATION=-
MPAAASMQAFPGAHPWWLVKPRSALKAPSIRPFVVGLPQQPPGTRGNRSGNTGAMQMKTTVAIASLAQGVPSRKVAA